MVDLTKQSDYNADVMRMRAHIFYRVDTFVISERECYARLNYLKD